MTKGAVVVPADAIKFRDRVIADLIPHDVANALLHQARVSDDRGNPGMVLRDVVGLHGDTEVSPCPSAWPCCHSVGSVLSWRQSGDRDSRS